MYVIQPTLPGRFRKTISDISFIVKYYSWCCWGEGIVCQYEVRVRVFNSNINYTPTINNMNCYHCHSTLVIIDFKFSPIGLNL